MGTWLGDQVLGPTLPSKVPSLVFEEMQREFQGQSLLLQSPGLGKALQVLVDSNHGGLSGCPWAATWPHEDGRVL